MTLVMARRSLVTTRFSLRPDCLGSGLMGVTKGGLTVMSMGGAFATSMLKPFLLALLSLFM